MAQARPNMTPERTREALSIFRISIQKGLKYPTQKHGDHAGRNNYEPIIFDPHHCSHGQQSEVSRPHLPANISGYAFCALFMLRFGQVYCDNPSKPEDQKEKRQRYR
jgi:hypothetical protein